MRAMHPSQVARQAKKYRETVRAADQAQQDLRHAQATLSQARLHQQIATEQAAASARMDVKSQAKLLDKFTRQMVPEYMAKLAERLGIESQVGKGLCQARWPGRFTHRGRPAN